MPKMSVVCIITFLYLSVHIQSTAFAEAPLTEPWPQRPNIPTLCVPVSEPWPERPNIPTLCIPVSEPWPQRSNFLPLPSYPGKLPGIMDRNQFFEMKSDENEKNIIQQEDKNDIESEKKIMRK